MAVTTLVDRSPAYATDGIVDTFATTFQFYEDTDLIVHLDGVVQSLTTTYTVTGGAGAVGSVVFNTPPIAGSTVIIYRAVPYTQPDNFDSDTIPAETVEQRFDKLTMMVQQVVARVGGTALFSGDFLSGDGVVWDGDTRRLTNLANASAAQDAVTKAQLDAITGVNGNVSEPTAGDVGKFWKATGIGATGWAADSGSLVPTPADPADNGKYINASAGAYVLRTTAQTRSDLGLGTAALKNTGYSDGELPLLTLGNLFPNSVIPQATTSATGGVEVATNAEVKAGTSATPPIVLQPSQFIYARGIIKAWAVIDGVGGTLVASYGLDAIASPGTGRYTLTLTNPFATSEYAVLGIVRRSDAGTYGLVNEARAADFTKSTSQFQIYTVNAGSPSPTAFQRVYVAVLGDII